ncbi:tricarballylate utilization 4Fe-4S protein TcuB [Xanthobacter sp.]|uniref:tricarballylate utilization 4Fe-4S protein TcuB n=1 Tax=Xanthobacter sp. TaxID=35809 RepID=UPI0025DCA190|nr:tricarballylate utilization 4Fe-4S protein TcuB [Xanthobacter sp.]
MHATDALKEADRLMTVCNSCRYCEGLCAVFPAMEMRRAFTSGDLNYLANLCHACGACYTDCQFSPPHEFDVNVPRTLAAVRAESWAHYAWPGALSVLFRRNGLFVALAAAASVALFLLAFSQAGGARFGTAMEGAGAFFRIMPHGLIAWLFGGVFCFGLLALALSLRRFWRDIGEPVDSLVAPRPLWQAIKDAGSLRYLDGGGVGCYNKDEKPDDNRRFYHHLTFYGFMLCFAATSVGALYHFLFGWEAPYPWWDLPVVLGTLGGLGLVVGPTGLLRAKRQRDPALVSEAGAGMDKAFTVMLLLTAVSGLLLLVLRATPAMNVLLAIHLGIVFALFLSLPYGRFVHGLYRFAALVRYAQERGRDA